MRRGKRVRGLRLRVGPQVDLSNIVPHRTPAKLALSLWSDPDINNVFWKGETQP